MPTPTTSLLLAAALLAGLTPAARGQRRPPDLRVAEMELRARELAVRTIDLVPLARLATSLAGVDLLLAELQVAEIQDRSRATLPPPARSDQDPADSLYRDARRTLNRGNYSQAAYLFAQIHERHPRSSYAPDAYYWEAYSLSRTGSTRSLNRALAALDEQSNQHPNASTRRDADGLASRIRGQLARQGDSEAARELEETARELGEQQRDLVRERTERARELGQSVSRRVRCRDDDDERLAALNALLNMDSDRALPLLERVMARRDEASTCLRRRAVFMISQQRGPRAESLLLEAVRSDPDREVREQGVFWLSQVDSERAVVVLDSILRESDDRAIQEKAIFAMSQHDSPRAIQALRDFAGRAAAPLNLRENAIFWLGQHGRGENSEFLRSLYRSVQEQSLKEKIIFSLAQHGGRDGSAWLLEIAANRTEPIKLRKNAIFWAAQSGTDLPELFSLYDRTDDREIREQLIFAYSQNGKRAAIDKLIEIARSDRDPELRKKALFWLSQTNDPRVAELLAEILEKP